LGQPIGPILRKILEPNGKFFPTFWDNLSVQSTARFLNPEDGTDRLSRNVGKILPLLAASYPRRSEVLSYFEAEG
jgi:hypothetical protein